MTVEKQLIDKVEQIKTTLNEISVYNLDVKTSLELYYELARKVNEVITELSRFEGVISDEVVKQNEKLLYLLGEGLTTEVVKKIDQMVADGTMDTIINHRIFNDLNTKIDDFKRDVDEQLNTIKKGHLVFSVKEFGAVGDGIVDDTDAIISTLKELKIKGGGTLYFPSGTYIFRGVRIGTFTSDSVCETIQYLHNVCFEGENRDNTIIKLKQNSHTDIFAFRYSENIQFHNITLDGNKTDNDGSLAYWPNQSCELLIRDSINITVNNCKFINAQYFGVNISSDTTQVTFKNNIIDNCVSGIDVCGQYMNIENNFISNCSDVALFLEGNEREINHQTYTAINAFINIINNKIKSSRHGIYVKNSFYCINVKNNNIDKCSSNGIIADASNLVTSLGIKSKNINIENNFVLSSNNHGILLNNIENVNVNDNTSFRNLKGIYISKCEDVNINSNNITQSLNGGIEIQSTNNNIVISKNIIKNNNTGNTTSFNTSSGIYISGGNNNINVVDNIYIGNTTSHQNYGIVLENNPTNIFIKNNYFEGNKIKSFIDKSGSSKFIFTGNINDDNVYTKNTILNEINVYSVNGYKRLTHTGIPSTGDYKVGDIVFNIDPSPNEYVGWICTQTGSPGTWKGFGIIES